jgi:2-C-methyl-D-erythritol 4-phosphate cytidylyltransferase
MPTAETASRCFALVPCAGVGQRAGLDAPKQYAPLHGRALVMHTLAALQQVARLQATLVVLAPGDTEFAAHAGGAEGERLWAAHCGGPTRAASVANGLAELQRRGARAEDWVLVHDAARCLLQPQWVDRLIDACAADAVGGLLALPVSDTLKQAEDGRVQRTLPRGDKWAAQTPQMFRLGLLRQALQQAGEQVTDEASAIEALGHRPLLVPGEMENFKITWPQDLALAERLIGNRAAQPYGAQP